MPTKEDKFWARIDQSGGPESCWHWGGPCNEKGYGRVTFYGRPTSAHRIAYELTGGTIPDGHVVRHRCDNPPCCNPAHLLTGTNKQNTADMIERARGWWQGMTHCKRGHEMTEENSMPIAGTKWRRCRACHQMHTKARIERRSEARRRARLERESAA